MPIRFFEGIREDERSELRQRNMERRFYALAAAVRDHQTRVQRSDPGLSEQDENLYRRLRQISGEPPTGEQALAEPPTGEQRLA